METPYSKSASDFEKRFDKIRFAKIEEFIKIDSTTRYSGQPDYIRFADVKLLKDPNNPHFCEVREVAFLDMTEAQIAACEGNYFSPLKMVIPRFFKLVDIDALMPQLNAIDNAPIDTTKPIFHSGHTERNLIFDVCLNISREVKDATDGVCFHACHEEHVSLNGQVCHHLAVTTNDINAATPHKILLFYVSTCDIVKGDDMDNQDGNHTGAHTGRDIMEKHITAAPGYFFIPLLHSDQSIVFYGIRNLNYIKNESSWEIKRTLKHWIEKISEYSPAQQNAILETNDFEMPAVDRWSISISNETNISILDKPLPNNNQPTPETGE